MMRLSTVARCLALACLAHAPHAQAVPSFAEVQQDFKSSETRVLSREGELLQRVRTDASVRRGDWVAVDDVSAALRTAMLLSEDRRFYEHSGVDWAAVTAAAWGNVWNKRTRGASTITMQLAGLLDGDWRRASGGRSVVQKAGQTVAAQVLDRRWSKTQILEAYLNLVPFRGEMVGIDALSRTLFDKAPHGLDDREAAVAAALVRAPNARAQQVGQRACGVLKEMRSNQAVDCEAVVFFTEVALKKRAFEASDGIAPHFSRIALRELRQSQPRAQVAATVRTPISAPVQRFAVDILHQHLQELRASNVQDAALVVLDNASGEVLAWVGSSGGFSQAQEVDAVLAPRQPGSTLKPFLYGQAIAEHKLTAASLIEDSPARIPTASGLYIPQNYDRSFKGWVSVRTALGASLNVPAVRTLVMVGVDDFFDQLGRLGMSLRESGSYFGYSLALGSPEIPLLQLTNAYRALANDGQYSPVAYGLVQGRKNAVESKRAMDAGAAYIVGHMLADSNARVRTFGTSSVLGTRSWTAVKTGTSKDMRDNWAIGWSDRYTVGVWVGNASGAAMHSVSGTSGAAPMWAAMMAFLHKDSPSRAPRAPAGVEQQWVDFGPAPMGQPGDGYPLEARRQEWFLAGTAQPRFALDDQATGMDEMTGGRVLVRAGGAAGPSAAAGQARILAPANGTIVAVDPDIPPDRQRLQFVADQAQVRWRMDGKEVARGARWAWMPWPGRHQIELVNTQGEVLDTIRLEVRGAGVKQSKK